MKRLASNYPALRLLNVPDPDGLFASEFALHAPGHVVRYEAVGDHAFLVELFCACSPLGAALPAVMLQQQAQFQLASHRAEFPQAAYWIIERGEEPVGRIVLDWTDPQSSHGVDIALLPAARSRGPGLALLKAWLATADRLQRTCHLEVLNDNRARLLYSQLGFALTGDPASPSLKMVREARASGG